SYRTRDVPRPGRLVVKRRYNLVTGAFRRDSGHPSTRTLALRTASVADDLPPSPRPRRRIVRRRTAASEPPPAANSSEASEAPSLGASLPAADLPVIGPPMEPPPSVAEGPESPTAKAPARPRRRAPASPIAV